MGLESGLVTELSSISGLNEKIYPLVTSEKANPEKKINPPYLVYVSSEGRPEKSLDGYEDLKEVPVELNVIGAKYSEMKSLTRAVLDKLESMENRLVGDTFVQEVTYQEPVELFESQVGFYRCVIDTRFYVER